MRTLNFLKKTTSNKRTGAGKAEGKSKTLKDRLKELQEMVKETEQERLRRCEDRSRIEKNPGHGATKYCTGDMGVTIDIENKAYVCLRCGLMATRMEDIKLHWDMNLREGREAQDNPGDPTIHCRIRKKATGERLYLHDLQNSEQ